MKRVIKLENIILEVQAEGYPSAKVCNVLDFGYKSLGDLVAESLGDIKELADVTITIETKESNKVTVMDTDTPLELLKTMLKGE